MASFPYFDWLARRYKQKAESSGHWREFLQAHGLANFCLSEEPTETRRRLVYEIEQSWYKGKHPLTYSEHQVLTAEHKQLLEKYREETRVDFGTLDGLVGELSAEDTCILSEQNLSNATEFCTKLFVLSEKCSKGFVSVAKSFIKSSIDILERQQERCPCKLAVVALGSVAKGEATPYSDLEYAFLVEKSDDYFEKLAVDSYFRIDNLGETPLRSFDIPERNEEDSLPNQESENVKIGFRIDGITESSGNIPTGDGKPESQTFTFTVEELMTLYKNSATTPFDGFRGDKSDMLSPASLIFTNEGTEKSQLLEEYMTLRMEYENGKATWDKNVREKRMISFVEDMKKYSFIPDFVSYQPPNNMDIKAKTDIFRYPTLLANNLKMCLGLDFSCPWETYAYLKEQGILSADGHLFLNIVLALSIYIRTKAYIEHKSQTEHIQIHSTMTDVSADKYYMPLNLFVLLGCLLIPVKQSINAALTKWKSLTESESTKDELVLVMQCLGELETNHLQKAEVLYFTGQYDSAKETLSKAIGQPLESTNCATFLNIIRHLSQQSTCPVEESQMLYKYLELSSYLLYYTNNYNVALDYFKWFIGSKQGKQGVWKLFAAHCHQEIGDFIAAKRLLKEAKASLEWSKAISAQASIEMISQVFGSELNHRDASIFCRNISHVYFTVSEYDEALGHSEKALEVDRAINGDIAHPDLAADYSCIAQAYYRLCEYALSAEYSEKSLAMYKTIHSADTKHQDIASAYYNVGQTYCQTGKYSLALPCFKNALAIYEANSNLERIAICYTHIGAVYQALGDYTVSSECLSKSLGMYETLYGADACHVDITTTYNELGRAFSELGDFASAMEFHDKALVMRKKMYGADANHMYIVLTYTNAGLLYNRFGKHDIALEYLNKAVAMANVVYGADVINFITAVNCDRMGFAHSGLGNDELGLEYLQKSLVAYATALGVDSKHPYIAKVHRKCAEIYRKRGDDVRALAHDTKALNLL